MMARAYPGRVMTARRNTTAANTIPIETARADLLIQPDLGHFSWIRFGVVEEPVRRGYEAARAALAGVETPAREPLPA